MIRPISISALLLVFSTEILTLELTPVVRTNVGPVQGQILRTSWHSLKYSSFRGIPFAKPPVGKLRFKPPVKAEPWSKVLNATKESTECIQRDLLAGVTDIVGSEDCLYLNVYTRETKFKGRVPLKPVMVWIFGGGFTIGYNKASFYGPDYLLEADVVLVAMNYRLGALGFLSLSHPDALGNAGLKDQALAMRWVKENIAAFGGDPNSITIFGHSAGGASVSYHLLSPNSRDLFHRSISISGSALADYAYRNPEGSLRTAFDLGSTLGCETQDKNVLLKCLQDASAEELIAGSDNLTTWFVPPFVPTKEDPNLAPPADIFLTECPINAYQNGRFNKKPHMMGYTKDEMIGFEMSPEGRQDFLKYTTGVINNVASFNLPGSNGDEVLSNMIKSLTGPGDEGMIRVGTEVHFVAPADLEQKLIVRNNNNKPLYYYRMSYDNVKYAFHRSAGGTLNGTGHGDDLAFLFDVQLNLNATNDPSDPFNEFRWKVVKLFANFAECGNPTPRNHRIGTLNFEWKKSGTAGLQLDIDEQPKMKPRLANSETQTYESSLARALPPGTCT